MKFRVKQLLLSLSPLALLGALLLAGCAAKPIPSRPELVPVKDVTFTPPAIEEWVEENGLRVMLLPNSELPLVEGTLYFPYGTLVEPAEIPGFTGALFSQIRGGGVEGRSPRAVDESLDAIGATIEGAAGREFSSVSFFSHKDDFGMVFNLLGEMLLHPAFDQNRLNIWKARSLDAISRRREDADTIAAMTFARAMYGERSPYSSFETRASISAMTPELLRARRGEVIVPAGALLTMTGRIDRDEIRAALKAAFGNWSGGPPAPPELPVPVYSNRPGIYLVEAPFEQAAVIMGEPGPARLSPDQYVLSIFNRYFSRGEFGSVLFSEIRSKRGYAYSVDGGFAPGAKGGEYLIALGTRTQEAPNAIAEVLNQIRRAQSETATEARLDEIRRAVGRGFVFNFATPGGALSRQATLRLLKYPADYNDTYIERISAVGQGELLKLARSRLDPAKFIIVAVGKFSAKELSQRFGPGYPVYRVRFDTEPKIVGQ